MVRRALVFSGVVGLGAIAICCASEEPSPDAASLDAPTPSDVAPDDSSAPVDDTNEPSPSPDAASASRVTRVYVGQDDAQLVVFALDDATGALTELSRTAIAGSTSFVALDGSGTRGAAVLEGDAEVVGLAITPGTGAAREVGSRRSSRGAGPTHVSIDGTGTRALVANYGGGTVSSFSLGADGALSEALDDEAPGANAHQILTTPSNRWALVPCLGSDRVAVLAFDATTGSLSGASAHDTAEGAGPRHLVVTADGAHVYLANELDSSLEALSFDEASGTLESLGVVSTLPAGFASRNSVAEIALGGRRALRLRVQSRARLHRDLRDRCRPSRRGHALLEARRPRSFAIDPAGRHLLVGAQDDDLIVRFRVEDDGSLTRLGTTPTSGSPTFVGAFAIPTR